MGLDMAIYAVHANKEESRANDSELCYWRKHPDLHGYIVNTFANGVDECQEIPLSKECVQAILLASEEDGLPHTEGFFFGTSRDEDKQDTNTKLTMLLVRMAMNPDMKVYYQASW